MVDAPWLSPGYFNPGLFFLEKLEEITVRDFSTGLFKGSA
jgi:hypothetical protein